MRKRAIADYVKTNTEIKNLANTVKNSYRITNWFKISPVVCTMMWNLDHRMLT